MLTITSGYAVIPLESTSDHDPFSGIGRLERELVRLFCRNRAARSGIC
jgi:hypothetical protein